MGCGVGFGVPFWIGSVEWKDYLCIFLSAEFYMFMFSSGFVTRGKSFDTMFFDHMLSWLVLSVLFWFGLGFFLLFVEWDIRQNGLPRRDQPLGV